MTTAEQLAQLNAQRTRIITLLQRLVPLANGLAASFRLAVILGAAALGWFAVWMLLIAQWPWSVALGVLVVALLPILVLARFWFGLRAVAGLPDAMNALFAESGGGVSTTLAGLHDLRAGRSGLVGAIGGLWRLGGLAGEANELFGATVELSSLFNPLSLLLGVIALICLLVLLFVAALLGLITVL